MKAGGVATRHHIVVQSMPLLPKGTKLQHTRCRNSELMIPLVDHFPCSMVACLAPALLADVPALSSVGTPARRRFGNRLGAVLGCHKGLVPLAPRLHLQHVLSY